MASRRSALRFALLSAAAFAVVVALVWAIVLRERSVRKLYLEFEAFRASAALLEAYRQDPGLLQLDGRILGFGVYGYDGHALARSGTAPAEVDLAGPGPSSAVFEHGSSTLVLKRPLGPEAPGMGMMRGMGGRAAAGGMMRGPRAGTREGPSGFVGPAAPAAPGRGGVAPSEPGARSLAGPSFFPPPPRSLWIEYALGSVGRERGLLLIVAVIVTLALGALYALLIAIYRRNQELREREARNSELVQLGQAASTLVHEIKNPLGVIRVQAASLRRIDSPAAREKAGVIEEEVLRLAGLADRIRDFLRGGEGETAEIELGPWLRDYAARYAGSGEARDPDGVLLQDPPPGARVRIDPQRLAQALDNLVANAREAAPEAGPVELALTSRQGHQGGWEISVADRGAGIPPELAERVFEPFFTTKERGSGIGLALARRIARAAGGDLAHRPRPGGGTVFSVHLPPA